MSLEKLYKENKISKIDEFEFERYINFFKSAYENDLEHTKFNLNDFPRWAIISGYYAMHDITKLFLAKKFRIKINEQVHKNTIETLKFVITDKEILKLIINAYQEYIEIQDELIIGKKKRVKAQYYTGSNYSNEYFLKIAKDFYEVNVLRYIDKINKLIEK